MAAGIQLYVNLDDNASSKIRKIEGKFGRLKKSVIGGSNMMVSGFSRVGGGFRKLSGIFSRASMVAKIGLAGVAAAAIITGAKFEQSMANVASVAGANNKEMKELANTARFWGSQTAFSASEAAKGMYSLASAGQTVAQIKESIGGTLLYAGAASTNLSQATETVVQSLKMFELQADQTNRVVNTLAAGISTSMLNAGRLQEALSAVGSTAHASGMAFEETVATLGALHNAGIMGARAGTLLKNVIVRLEDPNAEMQKLLGDTSMRTKSLAEMMGILKERIKEPADAYKAFGRIAAPAALALMTIGKEGLEAMEGAVTGTQKALEMYKTQMDTVSSKAKMVKSALQENLIATFNQLQPLITSALDSIKEGIIKAKPYIVGAAVWIKNWVTQNKDLIISAVKITTKIIAIVAVVMILVKAISIVASVVSVAIGVVQILGGIGMAVFGALAAAGAPVVLGIGAIIAIVLTVIHYFNQFKKQGLSTGQALIKAFERTGEIIVDIFKWVWRQLSHGLGTALFWMVDKILWFAEKAGWVFDQVFPGVTASIQEMRNNIQKEMDTATGSLKKDWGSLWNYVKDKAETAGGTVKNTFEGIKNKITGVIASAKDLGVSVEDLGLGGKTLDELMKGKGTGELTEEQKNQIKEQMDMIKTMQQEERAGYLRTINYKAAHTKDWLDAKIGLIEMNYEKQKIAAQDNAVAIAKAEIERDNAIRDAKLENQRALYEVYMQNNRIRMAGIEALSDAAGTFYREMFNKETSLKEKRERAWEDMKSSFISKTGDMLKAWLKQVIVNEMMAKKIKDATHREEKVKLAKEGAISAYKAFAGIPIVGPVLGAAAAASAFAFLMAFHQGGWVTGGSNEVVAKLLPDEYVLKPDSAKSIGSQNLNYMNEYGRIPPQPVAQPVGGGNTFVFQVGGGNAASDDELRDKLREKIIPLLEDMFGTGEFILELEG